MMPTARRRSLLMLGLALLLAGCERESVSVEPMLTVSVYEVGREVVERERRFYARVVPADLTRVAFRIPGKLAQLVVQSGQQVTAGQVIAQLEDSIQRQVLADAQAQFRLSKRQLRRADQLAGSGALTPAQRDEINAGYRLAHANLELAKAQLSYTVVRAPFDGIVVDVSKEVFESVSPGEMVASVYRNDRIDVLVNVPDRLPSMAHQISGDNPFRPQVVFSGDQTSYPMTYLKNSTARDPATQAFQYWLTMPAAGQNFPPGLPATVTVDLQKAGVHLDRGLVVPVNALQGGSTGGEFRVWRHADGVVNPVPVLVDRVSRDGAVVSAGLRAGDVVVTSGLFRLRPGQAVNIQSQNPGR